jgi:hypothetical protein
VGRVEGYTGRKLVTSAIKTLPNAMIKIRELEDEVEKVRIFYTKKVEEVQRKADVQMRALKRGTGTGIVGVDGEVTEDGQVLKNENENEIDENNKESEGPQSAHDEVTTLRSELNAAREALAVLQANTANSVITRQNESSAHSQDTYRAAELELVKLQHLRETESRLQKDRIKWQELAEERAVREERMETERRYTSYMLRTAVLSCYT